MHPQDSWLFKIKMCIYYALFACKNSTSYYNAGLKTTQSVGPQSNRCKESVQISRHPARALHSASERVPSTILCLLPWIFKLTRSPKRQSWDVMAHSVYNGWKIKSAQEPGLEHDAVQTVWIWQEKGGVVGLNEVASVRVGTIRHPSILPLLFICQPNLPIQFPLEMPGWLTCSTCTDPTCIFRMSPSDNHTSILKDGLRVFSTCSHTNREKKKCGSGSISTLCGNGFGSIGAPPFQEYKSTECLPVMSPKVACKTFYYYSHLV